MQRKKNIKLLIILGVLIVVTCGTYFLLQNEQTIDIPKDAFAYANTQAIDQIVLKQPNEEVSLNFVGNEWRVNNQYVADPQRISVLFAILKQVQVRRRVAKKQEDILASKFEKEAVKVTLYESGSKVDEFSVVGDEQQGITYMARDLALGQYVVNIPGYRSYLAGMFGLDANGWRNPLVFDINWTNLQQVEVRYHNAPNNNFDVIFDNRNYAIDGMSDADSLKLIDFLDDVSLLYVNDYLSNDELSQYETQLQNELANIVIKDVGNNAYQLAIFEAINSGEYLVSVDSVNFGLMEANLVRRVTKPKAYFKAKTSNQ